MQLNDSLQFVKKNEKKNKLSLLVIVQPSAAMAHSSTRMQAKMVFKAAIDRAFQPSPLYTRNRDDWNDTHVSVLVNLQLLACITAFSNPGRVLAAAARNPQRNRETTQHKLFSRSNSAQCTAEW